MLIWVTVIALIVVVPLSISGGFGTAFRDVKPSYLTVPSPLTTGYATLVLGSALALYLYPNAINAVLGLESVHKLRTGTKFRNKLGRYDHASDIVSGLVNFRIIMRTNRTLL